MLNRELQSYGSCEYYIEDVIALTDYLRNIDPQIDDALIKGFKQVCYFASFNGSVKLLNKKKEFELCTKWTSVRKQVKLAMYVKRQPKPRPSDADFDNHGGRNQEELDIDDLTTMTEEDKTKEIMDMEPLAMQWCEVISQNPPHLDVQFRPLTAMATTSFMMQLPQASSFNLIVSWLL